MQSCSFVNKLILKAQGSLLSWRWCAARVKAINAPMAFLCCRWAHWNPEVWLVKCRRLFSGWRI